LDKLVFEVESRRRIFEAVCKFPGTHLRELSRTVSLKLNLVEYHLHYLEKRELVYSVLDGSFKRYFPKDELGTAEKRDTVSAPDKPIIGLLRQQVPFRIVILLAKSGILAHGDLAKSLHKSPSTVSHHLEKLIDAGMVIQSSDERGYRLSDPARIERLLVSFTPQPLSLADGFQEIWESLYI
jgi:predicted transcriptional regulator